MKAIVRILSSLLIGVLFLMTGPTLLIVLWLSAVAVWAAVGNWFLLPFLLLPIAAVAGVLFAIRSSRSISRR